LLFVFANSFCEEEVFWYHLKSENMDCSLSLLVFCFQKATVANAWLVIVWSATQDFKI